MTHPPKGRTPLALHKTAMTLLLLIGSALPVAIAFFLIAATDKGENPLNSVPDYQTPLEETLVVSFGSDQPVQTTYRYYGQVRLVFEGPGAPAQADSFYRYADPASSPQLDPTLLTIDGVLALDALGLTADPPPFQADHLYSALYEAGKDWHRLSFQAGTGAGGALTITVVQVQ